MFFSSGRIRLRVSCRVTRSFDPRPAPGWFRTFGSRFSHGKKNPDSGIAEGLAPDVFEHGLAAAIEARVRQPGGARQVPQVSIVRSPSDSC